MRTDTITRQTETAPPRARPTTPTPICDPVALLARIYREAGLPAEIARRCALADFRCSFPQLVTVLQ